MSHHKALRRSATTRGKQPEPGASDIYARCGDACHAADLAFLRGYLTVHEMQQARGTARIVRDTSLAILRRKGNGS